MYFALAISALIMIPVASHGLGGCTQEFLVGACALLPH